MEVKGPQAEQWGRDAPPLRPPQASLVLVSKATQRQGTDPGEYPILRRSTSMSMLVVTEQLPQCRDTAIPQYRETACRSAREACIFQQLKRRFGTSGSAPVYSVQCGNARLGLASSRVLRSCTKIPPNSEEARFPSLAWARAGQQRGAVASEMRHAHQFITRTPSWSSRTRSSRRQRYAWSALSSGGSQSPAMVRVSALRHINKQRAAHRLFSAKPATNQRTRASLTPHQLASAMA